MLISKRYVATAALLSASIFMASAAHADTAPTTAGIQMLPPVNFDGTDKTPCQDTTAGLLYWDGKTTIKCVPGMTGDASGNVTLKGTTATQGADGNVTSNGTVTGYQLAVVGVVTSGAACTTIGAMAQDGSGKILSCQTIVTQTTGGQTTTSTLWQSAFGSSTGWVRPSCVAIGSNDVTGATNCQTTAADSPIGICQNAGYSTYTGACQAIKIGGGQGSPIQGSLAAMASGYSGTSGTGHVTGWSMVCMGNLTSSNGWESGTNLQILCSK